MIIGFVGSPRAGKDEVANFLVKYYNFKKIAFADQIKEEYLSYIGITIEEFEELKKSNMSQFTRSQLWEYSKKIKEIRGQDHFIKVVFNKINKDNDWVITDIRTKLELGQVLEKGAEVIFIKRSKKESELEDSELSVKDTLKFDVIINNKETIEELEENLKDFFGRKLMKSEESRRLG